MISHYYFITKKKKKICTLILQCVKEVKQNSTKHAEWSGSDGGYESGNHSKISSVENRGFRPNHSLQKIRPL